MVRTSFMVSDSFVYKEEEKKRISIGHGTSIT